MYHFESKYKSNTLTKSKKNVDRKNMKSDSILVSKNDGIICGENNASSVFGDTPDKNKENNYYFEKKSFKEFEFNQRKSGLENLDFLKHSKSTEKNTKSLIQERYDIFEAFGKEQGVKHMEKRAKKSQDFGIKKLREMKQN